MDIEQEIVSINKVLERAKSPVSPRMQKAEDDANQRGRERHAQQAAANREQVLDNKRRLKELGITPKNDSIPE